MRGGCHNILIFVSCGCDIAQASAPDLHGTKAPMTKPQSIIVFVKRMNHLLREPDLSSPLDSAQLTLPAGYSPIVLLTTEPGVYNHVAHLQYQCRPGVQISHVGLQSISVRVKTYKESPGSQHAEHALRVAMPVRASREGGEHDQDNGRSKKRACSRPSVGKKAKNQLANHL